MASRVDSLSIDHDWSDPSPISAGDNDGEVHGWTMAVGTRLRELLIVCEEDRTLRAVLPGMLRETDGSFPKAHREPAPHGDPAT